MGVYASVFWDSMSHVRLVYYFVGDTGLNFWNLILGYLTWIVWMEHNQIIVPVRILRNRWFN